MRLVALVVNLLRSMTLKVQLMVLSAGAFLASALIAAAPSASLATESETVSKVKTIADSVGTEGVEIILAVLTALVALIVAVIIIPKSISLIKRFV